MTNQEVVEMPLNGRMFTQLILLAPGATPGSAGALDSGNPYSIRGTSDITVNGSSPQNQSFLIDGIFNRSLWVSSLLMVPTIDSIQEVRVQTNNYSAEYGDSAGAVTVVQSKSGTNAIHGSAYEFLRNSVLDANQFFNNALGAPKPGFRRNQFGGSVGGPIKRDKLFYFGDYEGNRLAQPLTLVSTIPTIAQRAMVTTGDFSGLGTPVYDPTSVTGGLRDLSRREDSGYPPGSCSNQTDWAAPHADQWQCDLELHLQSSTDTAARSVRYATGRQPGRLQSSLSEIQLRQYGRGQSGLAAFAGQRRHTYQPLYQHQR